MLPALRSLLLGVCSLLLISGCGSSSYSSSIGSGGTATGGTGGTGGGPTGNPIGGGGGPTGSNDRVVATPSVAGTVSVIAGATRTVSITFTSSDGRAISGFGISGSLATLPAGWSGPSSFACASVSTGSGCVLNLTYAPAAVASGTLTLDYVFVDNATVPNTGGSLTIAYVATPQNNVVAAASPSGQINAVVGGGSQPVIVNFTTDDGKPATGLALTTDLSALPPGWSSTATSLSCATVSTGNGCQLNLSYSPPAAARGTLTLNYAYKDNAGIAKTGSLNVAYAATTNDNVVATASPTGQINAVVDSTRQAVSVTFTTDDGQPATALQLTSSLSALPAGWSSAATSLSCATVSSGNGCQLPLTYAPTTAGGGTLTLSYAYLNDAGVAKTGSLNIAYRATMPHLYVAQLVGPLYYCILNADGTLSSCAATGNGFTAPTGIVFNGSNFAYVTDYYNNAVYVCNAGPDGSLSTCVSTGSSFQYPWQLAINGNTLYATNANMTGGVTACSINADGTLSGCVQSPGSGASGIAVSSDYAYIGAGVNTVDVCAVGVSGSLTGCTSTGSGFSGVDGITLSGSYAYIANQANGTVNVCSINVDGSFSGCAPSAVGGQPTDVVIVGSQAYIDDAYGNIYLCAVGTGGALTNCAISNGGTSFNLGIQLAIH